MIVGIIGKILAWITSLGMALFPAGTSSYELSSMGKGSSEYILEQAPSSVTPNDPLPDTAVPVTDNAQVLGEWASKSLDMSLNFAVRDSGVNLFLGTACNSGAGPVELADGVLVADDVAVKMKACGSSETLLEEAALNLLYAHPKLYVDGANLWLVSDQASVKFDRK